MNSSKTTGPRLARRIVALLTLTFCAVACACLSTGLQAQENAAAKPLTPGQISDGIQCAIDPAESYALYLPSKYTPTKVWPILYAFDPLARGRVPVTLYKETAEKYGYIIAASNNSRNFHPEAAFAAAQAMWDDTHARLRLDQRRIYMMGFSGGARVATMLAIRCETCAVAGVISSGAGYDFAPTHKTRFAYFGFVGDQDFNWAEVVQLRQEQDECCASYHLKVFPGEHQWAPPAIFDEAIQWLQLKAMQTGATPPDPSFIDQQFVRTQAEAAAAVQGKDAISEFEAYRSLASDFSPWRDVTEYQAKLATMKGSPGLKQALKKEHEAIAQQRALTQPISSKLSRAADADLDAQLDLRNAIVDEMKDLQSRAEPARNAETRLVLLRAFNDLSAQAIEAGQAELENNKRFPLAEFYFQLMQSVSPNDPWPALLLAETDAARGDRKRSCKHLREAIKRGLRNPDAIEKDVNLQILRSDPEFKQIVAELKAQRESQPAR